MPSAGQESIVTVSHRVTVLLLASVATLQVGLTWAGLPGWVCPLRAATGIPCPGCGLSRALVALLHGHGADAVALHPFAPLVLAAGLGAGLIALLPARMGQRVLAEVATAGRRSHVAWWLAGALMVHWAWRLAELVG